jgi:phosphoribosylaminoimidazolecarboxamide formyltransferase/IMP cyclohydrolase
MASDAFFPFADAMEEAVELGVTAFVQPGGSINDEKIIARAQELGVSMVFTGRRYFRH